MIEVMNVRACGATNTKDMPWNLRVHGEPIKMIVSNRCCIFGSLGFQGGGWRVYEIDGMGLPPI